MNAQQVATVSDLYPRKWVTADDLRGPATVTIARVDCENFYQKREGDYRPALVLTFAKCTKRLILNRTQCGQVVHVLGSERLADWVGRAITLAPATAPNGKPTIEVRGASNGE